MKSILRLLILFFIPAMLTMTFTSCHSSKKIAVAESYTGKSVEWTTLYTPVNITVDKPMSASFSARATMKNGEYVHVSMRFIGMEVAVLYLDNDSAYFIDKYHKYAFAESLDNLLGRRYNYLSLADIQSIILGQKSIPDNDDVKIAASRFVDTPAGSVASAIAIDAKSEQMTLEGMLTWNPADATWNDAQRNVSFNMPSNYKRITLSSLKSYFKNLNF